MIKYINVYSKFISDILIKYKNVYSQFISVVNIDKMSLSFCTWSLIKCVYNNTQSACCWSIFFTGLPVDTSLIISAIATKSGNASVWSLEYTSSSFTCTSKDAKKKTITDIFSIHLFIFVCVVRNLPCLPAVPATVALGTFFFISSAN